MKRNPQSGGEQTDTPERRGERLEETIRDPGTPAVTPSLHQPSRQSPLCGSCSDPPRRTGLRRAPRGAGRAGPQDGAAAGGRRAGTAPATAARGSDRASPPSPGPLTGPPAARCPPPPHRTAGGTALQSADGARSALTHRSQAGKADLLFAFHLHTVRSGAWVHSPIPFSEVLDACQSLLWNAVTATAAFPMADCWV